MSPNQLDVLGKVVQTALEHGHLCAGGTGLGLLGQVRQRDVIDQYDGTDEEQPGGGGDVQQRSAPPTIAELAMEVGLNQLKLKRGFRSLFGMGVYSLFQRHRMERARELLYHYNVTETALMLGYSNISHFSTAFRKQFGVLPGEARKNTLISVQCPSHLSSGISGSA